MRCVNLQGTLTDIELLIVKEEQYDTNYDTVIYAVCARKKN